MSGKRRYRTPEKHTVRKTVITFIIMALAALLFPAVVMAAGQAYRAEVLRKSDEIWMQSEQTWQSDETGSGLVKQDIGINISEAQPGEEQFQQNGGQVQQTGAINDSQAQPAEGQLQQSGGQVEQTGAINGNGTQAQQSGVTGTPEQNAEGVNALPATSIRPVNSTIFFPVFSMVMPVIAGMIIFAACWILVFQEHCKKNSARRKKAGRNKNRKTV